MNPRENALAALRREKPERVPFGLSFTPPMYELFVEKTGTENPAEYWDFDIRGTYFRSPDEKADYAPYLPDDLPEGTWIDEWGIANVPGSMFHFSTMVKPLRKAQTVDEILNYPLPDFNRPECWQPIESDIATYHAQGNAAAVGLEMTIFEISWYLRGMEELMSDMLQDPDMATALLDRITELRIFQAQMAARLGADVLALGDDISMQTGMLMSPRMWRKWFKPRLADVIAAARGEAGYFSAVPHRWRLPRRDP